ncbi:MAG: inositol monophosphatase family protein [Anaerolineaceae bacterium]|nr:inositol monophosphatase family protein [Anaerolineaceae bacterium]
MKASLPEEPLPPRLIDLQSLAREAGSILRAGFRQAHLIRYKSPVDLVTEVDQRSEDFLVSFIQARFPDDPIITEESGNLAGGSANRWYIDPLDGTINFAHGIPFYAVSLAFADRQGMRLAVVYDPNADECFSAERGQGAWLGDQPISVSSTPDLLHSLLATGFPYDLLTSADSNLDHFGRLSKLTQGVRRLGSAVLDLCYVACGRLDGYWELKLSPWDLAAGTLIASEAGALVTDTSGNANFLRPPYAILAANPHLHPLIREVLRESQPQAE